MIKFRSHFSIKKQNVILCEFSGVHTEFGLKRGAELEELNVEQHDSEDVNGVSWRRAKCLVNTLFENS